MNFVIQFHPVNLKTFLEWTLCHNASPQGSNFHTRFRSIVVRVHFLFASTYIQTFNHHIQIWCDSWDRNDLWHESVRDTLSLKCTFMKFDRSRACKLLPWSTHQSNKINEWTEERNKKCRWLQVTEINNFQTYSNEKHKFVTSECRHGWFKTFLITRSRQSHIFIAIHFIDIIEECLMCIS